MFLYDYWDSLRAHQRKFSKLFIFYVLWIFVESEQNEQDLAREVQRADVVCLVYAVDDSHSLQQITERWLPLLQSLRPASKEDDNQSGEVVSAVPIILVGNKSDLLEQGNMEAVLPIMNHYAEIETCVEVYPLILMFCSLCLLNFYLLISVFSTYTSKYIRNVLLRTKSCASSYCTALHSRRPRGNIFKRI